MLRVSNLSKKFGDFQVLKNININAEKNQIYGLVGSNGCGKTTILISFALQIVYKYHISLDWLCGRE